MNSTDPSQEPTCQTRASRIGLVALGAAVTLGLTIAVISLLPVFDSGSVSGNAGTGWFEPGELHAAIGDGDYLFFPNRRNMWVVNRDNGRLVHYKFIDVTQGKVERSHVAQINQKLFPPGDTLFKISERNISDFLWVCNVQTGDFQLWRRSVRDGRLVTDPSVVSASQSLLRPVLPGTLRNP